MFSKSSILFAVLSIVVVLTMGLQAFVPNNTMDKAAAQEEGNWEQIVSANAVDSDVAPMCFIPTPSMRTLNAFVEAAWLVDRPYVVIAGYDRGADFGIWQASDQKNLLGAVPEDTETAQVVFKAADARDLMVSGEGMAKLCLYAEVTLEVISQHPSDFVRAQNSHWYYTVEDSVRHEVLNPDDDTIKCWFEGVCNLGDCQEVNSDEPVFFDGGGNFAIFLPEVGDSVWFVEVKEVNRYLADFRSYEYQNGTVAVMSFETSNQIRVTANLAAPVQVCRYRDLSQSTIAAESSIFVRGEKVYWMYTVPYGTWNATKYYGENPSDLTLNEWFGWGMTVYKNYLPMIHTGASGQ